jgi:Cu(I)/Ag(I) efflux system membrane fusion protein
MPEMDMVELLHEPIDAWDWPAMTMSFGTKLAENISQLKVGDRILAQLAEGDDSGYRMLQWRAQDDLQASPQQETNMSVMPTNEPNE